MTKFVSYSVFQDTQRHFTKKHNMDGGVQLSNKPREAVLYHENAQLRGAVGHEASRGKLS